SSMSSVIGRGWGRRSLPRAARVPAPARLRAAVMARARPLATRRRRQPRARWAALPRDRARACARCTRGPSTARPPSARPRPRSAPGAPAWPRGGPVRDRASRPILGPLLAFERHGLDLVRGVLVGHALVAHRQIAADHDPDRTGQADERSWFL